MSQAKFVRSQPIDMPVDELMRKAEAQGLILSSTSVYTERNMMRRRLKKPPSPPLAKSPKSDFIRAQPPTMKTLEIIKAAKASGLNLSESLVHLVRSQMRAAPLERRRHVETLAPGSGEKLPVSASLLNEALLGVVNASTGSTTHHILYVISDITAMLIEKNDRYADSALSGEGIFSKLSPAEAIRVRIDDKLRRMKNAKPGETEDTELDLLGYFVLLRVSRMRGSA